MINLIKYKYTRILSITTLGFCLGFYQSIAFAKDNIEYWLPNVVEKSNNKKVLLAHQVFQQLLSSWNTTRVFPELYVVNVSKGPMAASLPDGSILLSLDAIDIALQQSKTNGKDYLAFILAHELAHQQANDMWHYELFRRADFMDPKKRDQLLRGIEELPYSEITLEEREAHADKMGLGIMISTDFNPFTLIKNENFFSAWLARLWNTNCAPANAVSNNEACEITKSRNARLKLHLREYLTRATFFELGLQAFIAGDLSQSRQYFKSFAKEFNSHAAHFNIGLTHISETLALQQLLYDMEQEVGLLLKPPIVLQQLPHANVLSPEIKNLRGNTRKSNHMIKRWRRQMLDSAYRAQVAFTTTIRMSPKHKQSYIMLVFTQILRGKHYQAMGIIKDEYEKRFGSDQWSELLIALNQASSGKIKQAVDRIETILLKAQPKNSGNDQLFYELVRANKMAIKTDTLLQKESAKAKLNTQSLTNLSVQGYKIGDSLEIKDDDPDLLLKDHLAYKGEAITLYRMRNGANYIVDAKNMILGAWQRNAETKQQNILDNFDTYASLKEKIGNPSRQITTIAGHYAVFDKERVAILVEDNKVNGWFLF